RREVEVGRDLLEVQGEEAPRGRGRVRGKAERSRAQELGVVLVVDGRQRREVRRARDARREHADRAELHHPGDDGDEQREHHDGERRRGSTVVARHLLTSPRAMAVTDNWTVAPNAKGRSMRSSDRTLTRIGSRHATRAGSTSTRTRPGSMPTSASCAATYRRSDASSPPSSPASRAAWAATVSAASQRWKSHPNSITPKRSGTRMTTMSVVSTVASPASSRWALNGRSRAA